MSKKIKWGIIGAGGIARRRTLPSMKFCENAEIVAIMDKDTAALKSMQEQYGINAVYTEEDDLINDENVEAIYVATPVCFHKTQALKVLNANKHLLLEKPIGLNLTEAEEIMACAKASSSKLGIGMIMKMHPAHQKIRELIARGDLGDIVNCRAQLTCWFPDMENNWRQKFATGGGGALVDMGIHCIDLLRYLLDDEVVSVYGDVATKTFKYEVDDSADFMMRMASGANCFVDVHFNIPDNAAKGVLEIYGTKGSVLASGTISQDGGGEVILTLSDQTDGYNSQQNREDASPSRLLDFAREPIYAKQIEHFSNAILNDTEPFTTIENAYETAKIVDAIYTSSKERKAIDVK